jgi:hypothetical protein
MPIFVVEKAPQDEPAFRVLGPDRKPAGEIQEFLIYLSNCGRSTYTIRSYATGLAHFFGWLHERGTQVDAVTRTLWATTSEPLAVPRSTGLGLANRPRANPPRKTTEAVSLAANDAHVQSTIG